MKFVSVDSFKTASTLTIENQTWHFFDLSKLGENGFEKIHRLPFSIKILLENLLRFEDGKSVTRQDIEALLDSGNPKKEPKEISFQPARVLLQDFTGVPAVVDLAAMREAIVKLGGDPKKINPLQPVDLVIDHSVQVDAFGNAEAFAINAKLEFERNHERYRFLRWGQQAFDNFRVVPPDTGIVHQVNLEKLATVVFEKKESGEAWLYPDSLVGTDSHTTMINGLGILGWGVGGIEAEAAMLGQPITMLIPDVVGFKLEGKLREGTTATDLVLTITQMLRQKGVVGKFVEFYGKGLDHLTLPDRATLANMAPEYGATVGFFPIDEEALRYLELTGRKDLVPRVRAYAEAQGLFRDAKTLDPIFSETLELDLSTVVPSLAGPKRPQDRVSLQNVKTNFLQNLPTLVKSGVDTEKSVQISLQGKNIELSHGALAIAAITSCTNTSNPTVMLTAGLLAKKAVSRGLKTKPWVKTSLTPGSKAVTEYYRKAGLIDALETLGFHSVGYGCATCIGNSGPVIPELSSAVEQQDLVLSAVLSGNRNFEGRINPHVKANYLASPPLVIAYAIAGRMDADLTCEPLGEDADGRRVYLKDIWPEPEEIEEALRLGIGENLFKEVYSGVFEGDANWKNLAFPKGDTFLWEANSTYIRHPSYFEGLQKQPTATGDILNARVLALLGDSVTTDHISPAGSIAKSSPAGQYLLSLGVQAKDFNSYGARRGNHEVMVRGTFANIRLKNLMLTSVEGGYTRHFPDQETLSIYDAAMKYQAEKVPLVIFAGKEYGTGSSRDWAAKGTFLLGVRAVIAESFERIHRSNLVGMGVLPLEFEAGQNLKTLGLLGDEQVSIVGLSGALKPLQTLKVRILKSDQTQTEITVRLRIDTPYEVEYYRHGGILQYVLRQLL